MTFRTKGHKEHYDKTDPLTAGDGGGGSTADAAEVRPDDGAPCIYTAYGPRCYIIQKVLTVPSNPGGTLNPEAHEFKYKSATDKNNCSAGEPEEDNSSIKANPGYMYMNGDVGKISSGALYSPPEPLTVSTATNTSYSSLNGSYEVPATESRSGSTVVADNNSTMVNAETSTETMPSQSVEHLKQLLSNQLEYYFSRENLANDTYLLSQMDNDQYVPIWTVANFNQVKKLTKDIKLITDVLRESPNVQVDDEGLKVRPNHKRCIVILREIPQTTPIEEIKGLFAGESCPKMISCEFAHNNSWYITFENDEDAQKAFLYLREEVKEFQGRPIMARIKAKPMNRMAAPISPGSVAGMPGIKTVNGFRTPPMQAQPINPYIEQGPPAGPPAPPPQHPQAARLYYTNGGPPQYAPVNYAANLQVYQQQQSPYYPTNMLQHWPHPATGAYYATDIGGIFSVNGLAPQGAFTKPQNSRYNLSRAPGRSSGKMRHNSVGGSEYYRSSASDSGLPSRPGSYTSNGSLTKSSSSSGSLHISNATRNYVDNQDSPNVVERQSSGSINIPKDPTTLPPRYRRRKKEDEVGPEVTAGTLPQQPTGSQSFDLAADAFPPLPPQIVSIPHQSPTSLPLDLLSPRNHFDSRNSVVPTSNISVVPPEPSVPKTEDTDSAVNTESLTNGSQTVLPASVRSAPVPVIVDDVSNMSLSSVNSHSQVQDIVTPSNSTTNPIDKTAMPAKTDTSTLTTTPKANGTSNFKTTVSNIKAAPPSQSAACVIPQPPATFSADMANNNPILNGNGSPNIGHKLSYAQVAQHHKERNDSQVSNTNSFGQTTIIEEDKKEESAPVAIPQVKQSNLQPESHTSSRPSKGHRAAINSDRGTTPRKERTPKLNHSKSPK
ncbi:la-related protein 4 isoform X2 [Adelges cooleyi]|uniref:la-related protein 4 isoform X2 n=1 Tax=Adelges cooleyi TaxID=133065 RepID=UPI0021803A77|nr:la-related protein 4 isoform X2 [Adelges cooleyi]